MAIQLIKYPTKNSNLPFRVARGHFATSHSHINYYIDLTMTKHRLSEAREAAIQLAGTFTPTTVVDTVLCLDGMEVVGSVSRPRMNIVNLQVHGKRRVTSARYTTTDVQQIVMNLL